MNYVEARTTTTKRCGVQKAIAVMTITAICITLIGFMLPMVKIQDKTFKILQLFHNASFRVSKRTFQADVIVLSALLLLSISDIRSDCTSSDGFWASLTIRSLLSLSHVLLLRRMFMFVITMRRLLSISYAIGGYSIMAPAALLWFLTILGIHKAMQGSKGVSAKTQFELLLCECLAILAAAHLAKT